MSTSDDSYSPYHNTQSQRITPLDDIRKTLMAQYCAHYDSINFKVFQSFFPSADICQVANVMAINATLSVSMTAFGFLINDHGIKSEAA